MQTANVIAFRSKPGSPPLGMVETMGPLRITGWVEPSDSDTAPTVELFLNGVRMAETHSGRSHPLAGQERPIGFALAVGKVWKQLGAGDVLEVRCGDQTLPIAGHGGRYLFSEPARSESDKVISQLKAGYLLDRKGVVRQPLSEKDAWKSQAFALFDRLQGVVREHTGAELSIAYGTLLGCVREGDFIKHDDDFDSMYISSHSTPQAVSEEFGRLFQAMIDGGFNVRMGGHANNLMVVAHPEIGSATIDIFYAWFDERDELGISFGHHGRPVARAEATPGMISAELAGRTVKIPAFAERLLEQKYGETWRTPDHGFAHKSATRKLDKRYYVDKALGEKLYWNAFYARHALTEASTFAQLVEQRTPADALVLDIGCGTGKDTVFFAAAGRRAMGADASPDGVARASGMAAERGLDSAGFMVVDVGRRADLDALFASPTVQAQIAAGRPITAYMRFFLHSITEDTEAVLFGALKDHLPKGSVLAAEFRTDQDQDLPKAVKSRHFRRYMKPADFAARLEADYGFQIVSREESFGWSIFKAEDPHLCRLFAEKA